MAKGLYVLGFLLLLVRAAMSIYDGDDPGWNFRCSLEWTETDSPVVTLTDMVDVPLCISAFRLISIA